MVVIFVILSGRNHMHHSFLLKFIFSLELVTQRTFSISTGPQNHSHSQPTLTLVYFREPTNYILCPHWNM